MTGSTRTPLFPTTLGAYDTTCGSDGNCNNGNEDAFVFKLNPQGSALVYSTFLGGARQDNDNNRPTGAIAVDSSGRAYVAGNTNSSDFPVTISAHDKTYSSAGYTGSLDVDAFIARLSADGSALEYSTYLGGGSSDVATGIAVDAHNQFFVTGYTRSEGGFPEINAVQSLQFSNGDGFVTQFSESGSIIFSTLFGGTSADEAHGLALDPAGDACVASRTTSTDFITQSPFQATHGGGTTTPSSPKSPSPWIWHSR